MSDNLRFVPCGDRALMLYLAGEIEPAVNDRVHALTRALRQNPHPAVVEVTPSYHALLLEYDPVRIRLDQLEEMVRAAIEGLAPGSPQERTREVPVLYGEDAGPDLLAVAAHNGLSPEEVVRRHAAGRYRLYALGFSPGFPYLGGLEPALHTPRLAEPRVQVPGGSVGIGGSQTGIYPAESPGGWQLIGRTPLRLFDPHREPPALLEPGDTVQFVPVNAESYAKLEREAEPSRARRPAYIEGSIGLRVLEPGLSTTIQDLGRRGYATYGVPVAGAADYFALMVGNWLLANRARTSALEITMAGPTVEFTGPTAFCLTGAPIRAELIPADGSASCPVPGWTNILAWPGDRLRVGTVTAGCRSYLCVAGGFELEPVLGSLSEDLFGKIGPLGRPLQAGDWLPVGLPLHPAASLPGRSLSREFLPDYTKPVVIRVVRGPQAEAFSEDGFAAFLGGEYTVGPQCDRQGLRLQGPAIAHTGSPDILSEPIPAGAIQVPANGQPILLLSNRQTMGGYTKIAVAVFTDLAAAGQLKPGDRLRFQEVDVAEAHAIVRTERRRLAQIRRHLERELVSQPEPVVLPATTHAPAAGAVPPAPLPAAPERQPRVRILRLAIGGVEYEATVEDVDE